jgi:uncharacterized phiE125 gp8 family phage protein
MSTSSFKRTSAAGMPFSLENARIQLKNEEENYDDALITALVKAAGELAENKTNRAFMQSTWLWTGFDFPCADYTGFFKLYPGPLVGVTSVKYYAKDEDTQTTMTVGTDYEVDTRSMPGRIRFLGSLPSVEDRFDAVEIVFTAGYGTVIGEEETAEDFIVRQQAALPPDAVAWMKMQLTNLYEFRQTIIQGQTISHLNTFADNLIYPYII